MNTNSTRTWQLLRDIPQDLRYGWRTFRQTPGFTAIVVLTLALGIGANTAIFSIIHAVLLRPLPYKDTPRLVEVWDRPTNSPGISKIYNSYADLKAYQANSHSFVAVAGANWGVQPQVMSGRGPARDVYAVQASANFFSLLGVKAAQGRAFASDDVKRGCAVVLSDHFWRTTLGGPKSIVGSSISLDDQSCDVLGIMPKEFAFLPEETDLWTLVTSISPNERDPNRHGVAIFGRLKPGVTAAAALSELKILHKLAHVADRHARHSEPQIYALEEEFTSMSATNLRLSLLVLFAAVVAVLLIACVNVANLLLGRALRREKELAIRAAVGSTPSRLLRQLLTENLLLSFSAALLGTGLAVGAIRYFQALNPVRLPPGKPVEVNLAVLGFTAGLSVLTTLIFGLIPAWKGSKADLNDVLKSTGRSSSGSLGKQRVSRGLVVFEVMLSLVLLVTAGLLIRSVIRFTSAPLGFARDGVATMSLSLPPLHYATPAQRLTFYDRVTQRLAEMPEVRRSAFTDTLPALGGSSSGVLSIEGRPEPDKASNDTLEQVVSPAYFRVFQTALIAGREFTAADRLQSEPVAIVSQTLVRRYFPHEEPLGKHLHFRGIRKTETLLIVGVVGDEKRFDQLAEMNWMSKSLLYRPLAQEPQQQVHIVLRVDGDSKRVAAAVQRQLALLDPAVPVFGVDTMEHFLADFSAYPQFRAVLLGGFAALALLLSVVGLYGVLSQLVDQRTQEIGVRVALGAQRGDVLGLVLRSGMMLTGAGICLGLLSALAVTRFLASLLYGVGNTDLPTFGGVSVVLIAAAFAAMYLPARRAAKVDPIQALRHE